MLVLGVKGDQRSAYEAFMRTQGVSQTGVGIKAPVMSGNPVPQGDHPLYLPAMYNQLSQGFASVGPSLENMDVLPIPYVCLCRVLMH